MKFETDERRASVPAESRRLDRKELVIILLLIICILSSIAIEIITEIGWKERRERRGSHLRSLATAVESYYVDHRCYPAEIPLGEVVSRPERLLDRGGGSLSTLRLTPAMQIYLPKPVAYDMEVLADPFTGRRAFPFTDSGERTDCWPYAYYRGGSSGWIIWSPGPDLDYDIVDPAAVYDPALPVPSRALVELTYDPSNGVGSRGDLYRLKQ